MRQRQRRAQLVKRLWLRPNHVPNPWSPQNAVSPSLARSQRILSLHDRIKAKYHSDFTDKPLIDQRAAKVRALHELENSMKATKTLEEFRQYKYVVQAAKDALAEFDRAITSPKPFEPRIAEAA